MLIDFRVRNFRSFKEECELSLVASGDTDLRETNTYDTKIPAVPSLVNATILYGANAGGKSTSFARFFSCEGDRRVCNPYPGGGAIYVQPFRLDELTAKEPTLFESTVLIEGVRYQYGFEFTAERIVSEWLLVYQKAKPQKWFERKFDGVQDKIETGSYLSGPKKTWQEATRPNALFLSTAVQLNSTQLQPLFPGLPNPFYPTWCSFRSNTGRIRCRMLHDETQWSRCCARRISASPVSQPRRKRDLSSGLIL